MNIPVAPQPKISEGKPRPLLKAGTYAARIVQVIDLGTIESNWKGTISIDRTYAVRFETPSKTAVFNEEKGEQPFMFTENVKHKVTSAKSEMKSKLDKLIMATGGTPTKDFNIFDLLDKTLLIEVVQELANNGNTYNNVKNYTQLPEGMPVGDRVNDLKALSLDPQYFDQALFDDLGEYTQNKIMESPEYQQLTGQPQTSNTMATPNNAPKAEVSDLDEMNVKMPF